MEDNGSIHQPAEIAISAITVEEKSNDVTLAEAELLQKINFFLNRPSDLKREKVLKLLLNLPNELIKKISPLLDKHPELKDCALDVLIKKSNDAEKQIENLNEQVRVLDSEVNAFLTNNTSIKENLNLIIQRLDSITNEEEHLERLEEGISEEEVEILESRANMIETVRQTVKDLKTLSE